MVNFYSESAIACADTLLYQEGTDNLMPCHSGKDFSIFFRMSANFFSDIDILGVVKIRNYFYGLVENLIEYDCDR